MVRFGFLVFAWFALSLGAASATVCRLPGLDGYEAAAARAKSYLPGDTKNIKEMAVYIERDPNGLFYFHSNFISRGEKYATKIGGEASVKDIETAFMNLIFTAPPSQQARDAMRQYMLSDVSIYVNKDIFDDIGATALDFKGRIRFVLVDTEAKTSSGGIIIRTDRPPPFGAETIDGCCLNGRPPGKMAKSIRGLLQKSKIEKKETRIISLVSDTATAEAISKSSLSGLTLNKKDSIPSQAEIDTLLSQNRGKDIVVLGHVEGANFVARNAANEVVSSVSIEGLRSSAVKYDVLLIEMGCNTAGAASGVQTPGVAVATRFNTVDAAQRLAKALDTSKDLNEFFKNLSDETLQVVVDIKSIQSRTQYHAEYYEASTEFSGHNKIGDVTVTSRDTGFLSRIIPSWLRRQ